MQLAGAESGYVLVRSATGTSAVVKSVLPGQTAQFIVQAANGEGQQGVASAPVMITVPAAVVAHAAEAAPVKTHGNGNGNGNGNGRGYGHAVKTRVG